MATTLLPPNAKVEVWRAPTRRFFTGRWHCLALLLAVCGFFCFYGLGAVELYRNEGLRAILAREMLRTGNWIVPTLYGEPLLTKPPGMYIAIALCSWPFGDVTEWTARLPSAIAATATVLLVFWYFSRQLGPRAGLVAALMMPITPFWLDKSTTAEIDMLQVAWVTAAILFFLRGMESALAVGSRLNEAPRFLWILAAMICLAGGVLTKWTAPLFVYGAVTPLLWCRGRLRLFWSRQHIVSALVGMGIVLAWLAAAISQVGWEIIWSTVSREALEHLVPGQSPKPYSWMEVLLHPFRIFASTLPWSPLALLTLRPAFAAGFSERGRFLLQALHCWVWPSMVFWTFATEHSVRHSAPLFPALLGLSALALVRLFEPEALARSTATLAGASGSIRRFLTVALLAWTIVKVVYVEVVVPHRVAKRHTRDKAAELATLVPSECVLYLFRIKDEGILFYYGRPAMRLHQVAEIPDAGQTIYCLLTAEEWRVWSGRSAEVVANLQDAQGDAIVLVRVFPASALAAQ
ncbi:MAG: glycosyltransferase family 39 protein [Planctomycetes bacterium]|nr:glycosyltransferase family 39 protein [Planctomycetota bacterium]